MLHQQHHFMFYVHRAGLDLLSGFVETAAHERDFDHLIFDPHKKLAAALQDEQAQDWLSPPVVEMLDLFKLIVDDTRYKMHLIRCTTNY